MSRPAIFLASLAAALALAAVSRYLGTQTEHGRFCVVCARESWGRP